MTPFKIYNTHSISKENNNMIILYVLATSYIIIFEYLMQFTSAFETLKYSFKPLLSQIVFGLLFFAPGYIAGLEIKRTKTDKYPYSNLIKKTVFTYTLYLLAISASAILGLIDKDTFIRAATLTSSLSSPPLPTLWFAEMTIALSILVPTLNYVQSKPKKEMYYIALFLVILIICTGYKYLFQTLDTRLILYIPSFIGGYYAAQNRLKISTCFIFFISALGLNIIPIGKGYLESITTSPLILSISLLSITILNSLDIDKATKQNYSILYKYIFCAILFHRIIFYIFTKTFSVDNNGTSTSSIVILYLISIIVFSLFLCKTLTFYFNKLFTYSNKYSNNAVTAALIIILTATTYSYAQNFNSPKDYINTINYEMRSIVDKHISIKIHPEMQYSFALMEKGVLQNTDRRYTYDYIPEKLNGGYLFQGLHRTPTGTSFQFEFKEPVMIYFFFHTRLDGGYGSIFPLIKNWTKEPDVPMYDIYNDDHGHNMTMYSAAFKPGNYTIPKTTEQDGCIGFVIKPD